MTATTADLTTTPSRAPKLAALGFVTTAVLTFAGTFWDLTDNESGDSTVKHDWPDWVIVLGIAAVALAIVFGLVVRTAVSGHPGRRAVILAVVGLLSIAVFWAGLPMVLVAGAVACALAEKDKLGSLGLGSKVALGISAVTTALAVWLAIAG